MLGVKSDMDWAKGFSEEGKTKQSNVLQNGENKIFLKSTFQKLKPTLHGTI